MMQLRDEIKNTILSFRKLRLKVMTELDISDQRTMRAMVARNDPRLIQRSILEIISEHTALPVHELMQRTEVKAIA